MTTETIHYEALKRPLAGTDLFLLKGGDGHPVLVLHGIEGNEG